MKNAKHRWTKVMEQILYIAIHLIGISIMVFIIYTALNSKIPKSQ